MYKILLLIGLLASAGLQASEKHTVPIGDWQLHWSAFTGDSLSPEMARAYDITRSGRNAVLNVSVLKGEWDKREPVTARIRGTATNLVGQKQTLKFREVRETGAIYYIAEWSVAPEEHVLIRLEVQPEGATRAWPVEFRQKFYPDHRSH